MSIRLAANEKEAIGRAGLSVYIISCSFVSPKDVTFISGKSRKGRFSARGIKTTK